MILSVLEEVVASCHVSEGWQELVDQVFVGSRQLLPQLLLEFFGLLKIFIFIK